MKPAGPTPAAPTRRRVLIAAVLAAIVTPQIAGCAKSASPGGGTANGPGAANSTASASPSSPLYSAIPQAESAKPEPVPGKVLLGEYLDLKGRTEAQSLALRRKQLGRDPRIIHRYYEWNQPLPRTADGLPAGSVLLISWAGTFYAPILNGSQDALIGKAADALAALKEPVFLRWAWEMNGSWYDWGGAKNGNSPDRFIAAWRHIHDIFVAHKAVNVGWVWGPNTGSLPQQPWNDMSHYYPGDDYVDWVAISGYFTGRETPDALFDEIAAYGSRKPIMIAETGALERGGTVKADWIRALNTWIAAHPAVGALVWFDTNNDRGSGKNWCIDSTPATLTAYRELANDPRYSG